MNNNKTREISVSQIIIILTLFSVLNCVLFTDTRAALSNMLIYLAMGTLAISLLLIPNIFVSREKGGVIGVIKEHTKSIALIAALLYAIYLSAVAGEYLSRFSDFAFVNYFNEGNPCICTLLLAAVCLYGAYSGEKSICRTGTLLLIYAAVLTVLLAIFSCKDIASYKPTQIFTSDPDSSVIMGISAGAVVLCVLPNIQGGKKRLCASVYGSVAAMFAAAVILISAVCMILGSGRGISDYPIYDAVIYGMRDITIRCDGAFFLLWTIIAVAVISLLLSAASGAVKTIFPKAKFIEVGVTAVAVILSLLPDALSADSLGILNFATLFVLVFLIPLISALLSAKKALRNR